VTDRLLHEIDTMRESHEATVTKLTGDLQDVQSKLRTVQSSLSKMERLERALVSLYFEVRDRSTSTAQLDADGAVVAPNAAVDLEAERSEVSSLSPLVVLDRLRSELRALLAFKEDFEAELAGRLATRRTGVDETNRRLTAELEETRHALGTARSEISHLAAELDVARGHASQTAGEAAEIVNTLKADNTRLVGLLRDGEQEADRLRAALEARAAEVKDRDARLLRVEQLEAQLQVSRMQFQFDLAKMQATHVKALARFKAEVAKFSRTEAENAAYMVELTTLRQQMKSYRSDIRRSDAKSAKELADKRGASLERTRKELQERDTEIKQLKVRIDTLTANNAQLRKDYEQLFRSAERAQRPAPMAARASAPDHSFYAAAFKERLAEKDKIISELSAKIKRLLASQHRSTLSQRAWESERRRMRDEISEARGVTADFGERAAVDMRSTVTGVDVPALEAELQTLRSVSLTTAAAYERLARRDQGAASRASGESPGPFLPASSGLSGGNGLSAQALRVHDLAPVSSRPLSQAGGRYPSSRPRPRSLSQSSRPVSSLGHQLGADRLGAKVPASLRTSLL
jgi:DNA repair exonuclease SbcCD ATPase subunit